ncbi:CaiB/BaiF CoA transferase family protein [Nocardia sp. NBC_00416]|uniref:CaiB/BaiF CoA transferase family protein n=1 Tax=Nocardia sp. NBC_00416 TaxID=2975991 RepID=UPI002E1FBA9A
MTASRAPLEGLVVLDLTTFLSGPFCTQILADLGADVIKVEAPAGDSSRSIPPHFIDGDSAYYLGNNRNKKSIVIDLKSGTGLSVLHDLIAKSDVVVENYRPGVCARLGFDPAEMRRRHPALIWASISGFGQTGPWKDRPAYDMIVQALSGAMSLTGEPDRPAVRLGIPAGDVVAGMYTAIGICAAAASRAVDGRGDHIDVSMLDSLISLLSYQGVYSMITGEAPAPQAARHDSIPTYRSFVGGDGRELVVTANTDRMWRSLCEVLALPQLTGDPRFADQGTRLANKTELWELLEEAFTTRSALEWVESLQDAGVPAALIANVPEALAEARAAGRDMVLDLDDGHGNTVSVLGNPIKFLDSPTVEPVFPPRLGADSAEVLAEIGWSVADIEALAASDASAAGQR